MDDFRYVDVFIYVVDVFGIVDVEGKEIRGYDFLVDIVWLWSEIVVWILGNFMNKWGFIKRWYIVVKVMVVEIFFG